MLESTKIKYRKNVQGFIQKHFDKQNYSEQNLLNKLADVAPNYTAKSFSNLKSALCFFLIERGKGELAIKIKGLENPCVKNKSAKKRRLKKKTLNKREMVIISKAVTEKENDFPLKSSYILARILGARPSEMQHITQTSSDTFLILGSKKSVNGDRGLDRHVRVDKGLCHHIIRALAGIQKDRINRVQERFNYLMKQIFKGKKITPTLYALRHQFCSELKSSKLSTTEVAYLMGHQSTRTMENYGYANAGSGNIKIRASCPASTIKATIRDIQKNRNEKRVNRILNLKQNHPVNKYVTTTH